MDGFTAIPIHNTNAIDKDTLDNSSNSNYNYNSPNNYTGPGTNDLVGNNDKDIEIIDDSKKDVKVNSFGFLLPLSIVVLLAVLSYFAYLVFLRWSTLQQVSILSEDFGVLSKNLNKDEINQFILLDKSLKSIKERLAEHARVSDVLAFVNKNIRSSVQIADYRLETKEKEINVGLAIIAPSFRELAEQTEKMTDLKNNKEIIDFSVTQMALEADGRRIRFTLNLIFDKKKVSVVNTIQN